VCDPEGNGAVPVQDLLTKVKSLDGNSSLLRGLLEKHLHPLSGDDTLLRLDDLLDLICESYPK